MRMPFGKYKGETIPNLPNGYVEFIVEKGSAPPDILAELTKELETRLAGGYEVNEEQERVYY